MNDNLVRLNVVTNDSSLALKGIVPATTLANARLVETRDTLDVPTSANTEIIFTNGPSWFVTETLDQITALFPTASIVGATTTA